MDHGQKIRLLARTLIGKHGRAACKVAQRRAARALESGDFKSATAWSEAADAIQSMGAAPVGKMSPEPALSELVRDPLTQAVSEADGVDPEGLDRILSEASGKLGRG
jgi:hypothetical protein